MGMSGNIVDLRSFLVDSFMLVTYVWKFFACVAEIKRLTKSHPGEQRRSVLSSYISNDLLGIRGGEYADTVISLIMTSTVELRQSIARLLNSIASLTSGRSYLSHGPKILLAIMDNVRLNKLETISLDMSIATLQKLSLRRQLQTAMIENDMIEWLLSLLEDEDSLSDYALEYAVALLMNLCLRTAGKQRCSRNSQSPLKVLTSLLGSQNQEIVPYVNGTLYSLLSVPNIKREAQVMGLEEMLSLFMKETNPEMKRQLEFIMRQLSAEDPVEDVLSDYEDEDDDDEDQDILEEELDKDDVVIVIPGERQGERLLTAYYSLHANNPKQRSKQIEDVFVRPKTPKSRQGSAFRRKSSQIWTRAVIELPNDTLVDVDDAGVFSVSRHSTSPNPSRVLESQHVDHYASHVLNEVVGIDKPVAEAESFPPVLPREPKKQFGSRSVDEYVVAFSSRPKIPRTPEHSSGRRSQSPYAEHGSHSAPSRDG